MRAHAWAHAHAREDASRTDANVPAHSDGSSTAVSRVGLLSAGCPGAVEIPNLNPTSKPYIQTLYLNPSCSTDLHAAWHAHARACTRAHSYPVPHFPAPTPTLILGGLLVLSLLARAARRARTGCTGNGRSSTPRPSVNRQMKPVIHAKETC
jgi:hypothetical protein